MDPEELTVLLAQAEHDPNALARVYDLVEPRLREIAHAQMRGERRSAELSTCILVQGVLERLYARPDGGGERKWNDREHFFNVARRIMRRMRIDHGRRHQPRAPLDADVAALAAPQPAGGLEQNDFLSAVAGMLAALAREDPEAARVFELRFFGDGEADEELLSERETARRLGCSRFLVRCAWERARRYLQRQVETLGLEPPRKTDG